jgi:hypothetical protein
MDEGKREDMRGEKGLGKEEGGARLTPLANKIRSCVIRLGQHFQEIIVTDTGFCCRPVGVIAVADEWLVAEVEVLDARVVA